MHGLEGLVVATIDLDDQLRMLVKLLDVDPGAEAAAFGADDNDAGLQVGAQGIDGVGQGLPLVTVERIDRRLVDDQFGHAIVEAGDECGAHSALPATALGWALR